MENTFSFYRFSLLVKRQWIENKKLFLMGLAVIIGVGLVGYGISTSWRGATLDTDIQFLYFIAGIYFVTPIFSNFVFKDFSNKNSTTSFLTLPATHLEKLLTGILYGIIIFPILYLLIFLIIDYSFVNYLNTNHEKLLNHNKLKISNWRENTLVLNQILEKPKELLKTFIALWFFIQAVAILGAVSFGRWSLIKTAFCGFGTFILLVLINLLFHKLLLADLFEKLASTNFIKNGQLIDIQGKQITVIFADLLVILLQYILPIILLITAYFKLKEKQV